MPAHAFFFGGYAHGVLQCADAHIESRFGDPAIDQFWLRAGWMVSHAEASSHMPMDAAGKLTPVIELNVANERHKN